MSLSRLLFLLLIFMPGFATANSPLNALNSQVSQSKEVAPTPFSLKGEWWLYIDSTHQDLEERIKQVKSNISQAVGSTSPQFQKDVKPIEQTIDRYLDSLLELSTKKAITEEFLLERQDSYSVEEFISLFESYHTQRSSADRHKNTIRNEEIRAKNAENSITDLLLPYRDADDNSTDKLRLGLLIMSSRLQWLVSEELLKSETIKLDDTSKSVAAIFSELEYASTRLESNNDTLALVDKKIGQEENRIKNQQSKLSKTRELYTNVLGIDYISNLKEKLYTQKIINEEIVNSQSEVNLSNLYIFKALILASNPSLSTEEYNHIELLKQVQEVADNTRRQLDGWKKHNAIEQKDLQEIITSGTYGSEDKKIKDIVEERVKAIKLTAIEIPELEEKLYNLNTLITLYEGELGDLKGWLFKLSTASSHIFDKTFGNIWEALNYKLFVVGDTPLTSWDFIQAILSLVITYLLAKFIQKTLIRLNKDEEGKIPPAIYTLSRVVFYLIIVLGVVVAFSSMGIDFTKLAIIAGALSVGIGFGLQSVVSNFVSGIIILFEHNIKVGDFIELDSGLKGHVVDIDVRSTIVKTLDNLDIIVPNSELVAAKVTNFTLSDPLVRIHIPFGVAYGTDKNLVKKAVLEAARRVDITYDDGAKRRPQVWLVGFGESSLDFELVNWVNPKLGKATPGSWRALYNWEIESALQRYNIEIPFPQRDIHMKDTLIDKHDLTELPEQL